jgi:hypothetical protein
VEEALKKFIEGDPGDRMQTVNDLPGEKDSKQIIASKALASVARSNRPAAMSNDFV